MIPNNSSAISAIMSRIGVGKTSTPPDGDGDEDTGLSAAADALISALFSKDPTATASALRSVFSILEAQPHEEAEAPEPSPPTAES